MFVQGAMDVIEDKQKTKAELLQELIALRSRITELNQAEERLKYILTTSPVTIYTCEVGGNWAATFISENIRDQFAYEPNQFLEDHNFWVAHIHPDDRERVLAGLSRLFQDDFHVHEYRFLRKDGSYRWVHDESRLIRDEQDEPLECIGYWMDITEHKQLEQKVLQSEEQYRTLVESAGESIATIDEDGVFLFMNETGAKRLGGKPEDYVGKTMWDLFPKEIADRQAASVREVINTKQGMNQVVLTELQGQPRWYNTTIEPLRDGSGKVTAAIIVARDIHTHKRAEEELEIYRERMARAEELASLGSLSATVAHELTQPLTVISLSIENALAKLEATSSPETVIRRLNDSLTEVSNITSIVERFRNFARRSSDEIVREIELGVVGERVVKLLNESARRARIALCLNDVDKLPPVYLNEKDMEQLFFALADNAIQAAEGKKSRQLIISGAVKNEYIELSFSDNCGGVAPEDIDKIFEPFFTTKPKGQGTGLGLCIVQSIVSRAGGKIRVESKFGEGSTFFVTLPINKSTRS